MKSSTMKAIVCTSYGSPDYLEVQNRPLPTPAANEILVEVHASTVTKADTMMRQAQPFVSRFFLGFSKPKHDVMGTGFAGTVVAIGNRVKTVQIGERVFGETGVTFGANAEYLTIAEDQVFNTIPEGVSFAEAATISDGPMTSYNFLTKLHQLQASEHILINGASGSLGTAGVQLAKLRGATITAVCSPKNADLVKSLGADYVIDYHTTDFTTTGHTYDVIYDTIGNRSFRDCKRALTPQGVYLTPVLRFGILAAMLAGSLGSGKKAKFDATGLQPAEILRPMLKELSYLLEKDQLKVIIDRTYPLVETPLAHAYVDGGHKRGNVIIEVKAQAA
ncbi:MAG: NAD(P)-dependent alcohol dehydrogenase [Bacteroidota bacterium]